MVQMLLYALRFETILVRNYKDGMAKKYKISIFWA